MEKEPNKLKSLLLQLKDCKVLKVCKQFKFINMAKKKEEAAPEVVAEPTPVQKYDGISSRGYRSPGNLSAPVVEAPVVEEDGE
jgi:hypothetical protein